MIFKNQFELLKKLFIQKDISFFLLLATVFLLPLSTNLSTFTFILSLTSKMFQLFFFHNKIFATKALKDSSLIGLVFFVFIILNSIIQTDINYTINVFEKQFSHWTLLFLSPMLLKRNKFNELLVYSITAGTITAVIYVYIKSLYIEIPFNKNAFIYFLDLHHTYLCLFILFIINRSLIDIVTAKEKFKISKTILNGLLILTSLIVIFALKSKASIVIAMLLFVIHFFPKFNRANIIQTIFLLFSIICVLYLFNRKLNVTYETAFDFRLQIWDASIESIEKNPFFGDLRLPEKDILNYRHFVNAKYYFLDSDLNCHNQYFSIVLKYGIFGTLILLMFAVNIFKKTNKRSEVKTIREFVGFASTILILFYIENVLDRHHGIVFFTIFYNYYLTKVENESA